MQKSDTEIWKIPAAIGFLPSFNAYQEQFEQRLCHQLASPRLKAFHDNTENSLLNQALEEATLFTDSNIARYKALNINYAHNPNPSSDEDLRKLQELILLDIRFLAGCDILWEHRPSSQQSSRDASHGTKPQC
jgi:hypothetical protein